MHAQSLFRKILLLCVIATVCATNAFADATATRLVVFGDSLSDPGNFYAAFGLSTMAPYSIVPSAPYAIGGHHFTNGRTWVEQLAQRLGAPASARAALLTPGVATNYAVGGARARANAPAFPYYDLTTQVNLYLGTFAGRADPAAVHVVFFGGNDLRDALAAAAIDQSLATSVAIVTEAVQATASNIVVLWSSGARLFLVPNIPDLSKAPAIAAAGPAAQSGALQLTMAYNGALDAALGQLAGLPGIRIVRVDDFSLVDAIVAQPQRFGLDDATTPCLRFGVVDHALCEEPEDRLFWDGIHPTTAGHRLIADAARQALSAAGVVPR